MAKTLRISAPGRDQTIPRPDQSALAAPSEPVGSSALRLFRFERRWLVRIFESLLPSGVAPRFPIVAADVPMGRFIDDLLRHAPLLSVIGLRAGLWMLMLAPPVAIGRWRSFLGLEASDRLAVLDDMRRSRHYLVREVALLFKIIGCLGFCGLPAVQRSLGIHPTDETPPSWAARQS